MVATGSHPAKQCHLMGSFGVTVQLSLFMFCLSALWIKRNIEKPRRKLAIFMLDIGKQVIAQTLVHFVNIWISAETNYECASYLFVSTFDTFGGLFLNYLILSLLNRWFKSANLSFLLSGNYFSEESKDNASQMLDGCQVAKNDKVYISYGTWTLQALVWCLVVLSSKFIMYLAEVKMNLAVLAIHDMLRWLPEDLKIVFVLVVAPALLNALVVWIQDNLLKKKVFSQDEKELLMMFYEDHDHPCADNSRAEEAMQPIPDCQSSVIHTFQEPIQVTRKASGTTQV